MRDRFSELCPIVTFSFFAAVLLFSMIFTHPAYVAVSLAAAVCYNIRLTGRKGLTFLLKTLPLFLIIAAVNPLFNIYGKTVLFSVFGRPYSLEALYYGINRAAIFVSTIMWFRCYSEVMTSDKFTSLFADLIPSLSLLLVMVLRLVPSYIRKTKQIAGARQCLGLTPDSSSSFTEKMEGGTTVLSAMTSWALDSSVVTADSMRARGYGAGKRSTFETVKMKGRDVGVMTALCLLTGIMLAAAFSGCVFTAFTPDLEVAGLEGMCAAGLAACALYMFTPTILSITEAVQWHILRSRI